MKKIALALAITSALTSHFAFAAKTNPNDGEPILEKINVKAPKKLAGILDSVTANAGNTFTKDSTVKLDRESNASKVTDIGTYNAIKSLDEGRMADIQKDIRRGNEINARILANAVSGTVDKAKLAVSKAKAISKCNKQVATSLGNENVQNVFKGTPVLSALQSVNYSALANSFNPSNIQNIINSGSTFGQAPLIDTSSLQATIGTFAGLQGKFDLLKKAYNEVSLGYLNEALVGIVPGIDVNNLDRSFKNLTASNLFPVIREVEKLKNNTQTAGLTLASAEASIRAIGLSEKNAITEEFGNPANSSNDLEAISRTLADVDRICDKGADLVTSAAEASKQKWKDLEEKEKEVEREASRKCMAEGKKISPACQQFFNSIDR